MKRLISVLVVLVAVTAIGCGGGGAAPPPFQLTVDTVTVDGTVADAFDTAPEVDLGGTPLTVTAGQFSAVCDTTTQTTHIITATDDVNNTETLTVQVN